MVGREISDRFPKRQVNISEEISLEVRNWTVFHPIYEGRKVVDVSFYIRKGVVGI